MVHARGYNNPTDIWADEHHEINLALNNSKNTENIVWLYKHYGGDEKMTPE